MENKAGCLATELSNRMSHQSREVSAAWLPITFFIALFPSLNDELKIPRFETAAVQEHGAVNSETKRRGGWDSKMRMNEYENMNL